MKEEEEIDFKNIKIESEEFILFTTFHHLYLCDIK
jgi:hypothetical protein